MRNTIIEHLARIQAEENVRILYACESGSRAWGFASEDSDYDVRFIYVRPIERYLALDPDRDVIEWTDDSKLLDFAGWDLRKALYLFRKSNPPLLEWLQSPQVYMEQGITRPRMVSLVADCFAPRSCIYHYLHMAEGNHHDYFRGQQVIVKKYFYVLRPLFACHWIEKTDTMAPIEFRKLFEQIPDENVLDELNRLLERKLSGHELDLSPRIPLLDKFIIKSIEHFKKHATDFRKQSVETCVLDELFIDVMREAWDVRI